MNIAEANALISQVHAAVQKHENSRVKESNDYNPLSIVRNPYDEVNLHSRLIHSLLDPSGVHNQNQLFLVDFFKTFGLDSFINSGVYHAYREWCEIDIFITDNNKHVIIENKLHAEDQDKQIYRYIQTVKKKYPQATYENIVVIYLSLDRMHPTNKSLHTLEIDGNYLIDINSRQKQAIYQPIPYHHPSLPDLLNWLETCRKDVANITNLSEAIKNYISLVNKITGQDESNILSLTPIITESITNYRNARELYDGFHDFREQFIESFMSKMKNSLYNNRDDLSDWNIITPQSDIMIKKQGFPFRIYNKLWLQPSEKLPKLMYAIEFTKDHCEDIRMGIVKRDKSIDITALTAPYGLTPETEWWLHGVQESAYFNGDFIERIFFESGFIDQFIGQFIGMIEKYEVPLMDIHKEATYRPEKSHSSPYNIEDKTHHILNKIMDVFSSYENSFHPLPDVFLSDDLPPLLRKGGFNQDQKDLSYDDWPNHHLYDLEIIDELLGCYNPRSQKITLFSKGIHFVSRMLSVRQDTLISVVLVHEVGHWIMHQYPLAGKTWNTNLYQGSETNLHEGWAQLITYWVAKDLGGSFEQVFDKLNRFQGTNYHEFTSYSKMEIIKSLKKLRERKVISNVYDWKKILQKKA